jgi:hypothetical protein
MVAWRQAVTALLFVASCSAVSVARAFAIERAEAQYADKRYQFELVATIDAPVERVQSVLTDYEGYPALDPRILESRVLERPQEHVALLQTTLRMCFGPFCRNVKRVERVEESANGLSAVADPQRSDVSAGETHTTLMAVENGTRVSYRTSITPSFWIPAVVGRRWMLNTLRDATIDLFKHVEQRAQAAGDAEAMQPSDTAPAP